MSRSLSSVQEVPAFPETKGVTRGTHTEYIHAMKYQQPVQPVPNLPTYNHQSVLPLAPLLLRWFGGFIDCRLELGVAVCESCRIKPPPELVRCVMVVAKVTLYKTARYY